ncbi:MAG: hypothetical protein WCP95_06940 [Actinomycetes bacterium]
MGAGVLDAEADVVQASAASQGDLAAGVAGVVTDAEVAGSVVVGGGLGAGGVGGVRGSPAQGSVLAPVVALVATS